jgi:hypothetical protein
MEGGICEKMYFWHKKSTSGGAFWEKGKKLIN